MQQFFEFICDPETHTKKAKCSNKALGSLEAKISYCYKNSFLIVKYYFIYLYIYISENYISVIYIMLF